MSAWPGLYSAEATHPALSGKGGKREDGQPESEGSTTRAAMAEEYMEWALAKLRPAWDGFWPEVFLSKPKGKIAISTVDRQGKF